MHSSDTDDTGAPTMRRLILTAALALVATAATSQTIGTRTVEAGAAVEVYFQGTDPSPRCTAIAEIPDAIEWWRDAQGSVLTATLYLSADTYLRSQGGLCEFAIRVETADGPAAFVAEWGPRCGLTETGTNAERVAYCIAEDLRSLLKLYRERTAASVDPGSLADPPE